jgi:hypothetical protein
MNLNLSSLRYAVAALVGGVLTVAALHTVPLKAATTELSGSCGGLLNFTRRHAQPGEELGSTVDVLIVMNFTGKKAYISVNSSLDDDDPGYSQYDTKYKSERFELALADSEGPIPGSRKITVVGSGSNGRADVAFNVLPVNSGNTFLIQTVDDNATGVCQKL